MKRTRLLKSAFAAATLSSLLLCSCSDMFQERVPMQTTKQGTTLASLFNATKTIEKLDAPKQVFVTNCEYNDKIIVNWEAVEGAKSYKLERAKISAKDSKGNWLLPGDADFETLEHSSYIDGTTYTDIIIDNSPANVLNYTNEAYSCVYYYRVSAENNIANYESSDPCPATDPGSKDNPNKNYSEAGIRSCSGTLLTPPTNVKASGGKFKDKIELSWTRPQGSIASYRIYRSTNSDGSGASQVATVYGNSEGTSIGVSAENQGAFFYFTVVSVGASGNESVASSVAMGYTLKEGAPSQPTGVEIEEGRGETKNKITIKWNASNGSGDIKYSVYRYSSADSTQKQLTSSTGTDQTTFEDLTSSLKPNIFYYYQVQAWVEKDGEHVTSQISDSGDNSANPAEGYLLSPPQSVVVQRISGDNNNNKIVFTEAIGSEGCASNSEVTKNIKKDWNNYSYAVFGSDTATGFTDTPIDVYANPTKSSENGYCELIVPNYKFYKMATVRTDKNISSAHTSVVAPAPNAAQNLSVTKNGAIPGYTDVIDKSKSGFPAEAQANANGVHAIKLTWQAPVGGADGGYHIYRSTKPDSGFKKITENPVTDLFYIYKDEQAKAGNYYYYRVLSLNSLGQGNNYSNVDYGYGALTCYMYVREYIKTTLNSQKKLTLMHKSGATDKLGSESCKGDISGTLSYDASVQGLGGRVIMHYTNYADYYIMGEKSLGVYFLLEGNTNTKASMDTNGTMDGTVTVQGMYPGSVVYDAIQIKGGAAGGGTYGVTRNLNKADGQVEKITIQADWTWGEK